jgi:hypothetical protein
VESVSVTIVVVGGGVIGHGGGVGDIRQLDVSEVESNINLVMILDLLTCGNRDDRCSS